MIIVKTNDTTIEHVPFHLHNTTIRGGDTKQKVGVLTFIPIMGCNSVHVSIPAMWDLEARSPRIFLAYQVL